MSEPMGRSGFFSTVTPETRRALFDVDRQVIQEKKRNDALEQLTATTAWTAVTFANGWINNGGTDQAVQIRKVGDRVEIRGAMKSGTIAATAFTLPVGFRPPAQLRFPQVSGTGTGAILIDASGNVTTLAGSSNALYSVNCGFSVT